MRHIKVKELSSMEFDKYGMFMDLLNPNKSKLGEPPIEFFRDMLPFGLGAQTLPSLSVCRLGKRPLVIDTSEFHSNTCEVNVPLDGDILMHVAPASESRTVPVDEIEVFRVPKGMAVMIHPGVWHHAAFVYDKDSVNVLVVLPERTYANDCFVYHIPAPDQLFIDQIQENIE